jgi:hypothetical protein
MLFSQVIEAFTTQPEFILSKADHDSAERVRDFEKSRETVSSVLER